MNINSGSPSRVYRVIKTFDMIKCNIHIEKRYLDIIKKIKPIGREFDTKRFYQDEFSNVNKTIDSQRSIISRGVLIASSLGMVQLIPSDKTIPVEFKNLKTIQFWQSQLRSCKNKNLKSDRTTKDVYLGLLWAFNKWLLSRDFEITKTSMAGENTYKQHKDKVYFSNIEDLLELLLSPIPNSRDVIIIVKQYLMDETHLKKSISTMQVIKSAIQSYFEKNDCDIKINYNVKIKHDDESIEQSISIKELMQILTVGKPSLLESAVMLCKFHRGLDASTLADRFNFEAWDQIVKHFGSDMIDSWDLDKCPVPITLTRIKTGFSHVGFLDIDAIDALQKYLKYKEKKTGKSMTTGEPMFINKFGHPITLQWVIKSFNNVANRAGVRKCIGHGNRTKKYNVDSHELRDLLKSTLIDCGCRLDISDHVIGHKPKDSYEKQAKLYPETLRMEFSKASKKLNLFTQFGKVVDGTEDGNKIRNELNGQIQGLKGQVQELTNKLAYVDNDKKHQEDQLKDINKILDELKTKTSYSDINTKQISKDLQISTDRIFENYFRTKKP